MAGAPDGYDPFRMGRMGKAGRLPQAELARLLGRTSRTFALAIPLLEEPLAEHVGIAYLILRIADTLEDAPLWRRAERASALASFARWLDGHEDGDAWLRIVELGAPTRDEGCLELIAAAARLRASVHALTPQASQAIVHHTKRTTLGMLEFVVRQDERGALALTDLEDLRRYAYSVAGIVGELLTDLFVIESDDLTSARAALDADAAAFGEGLQLVNILKDAATDAREGRSYLPPSVARRTVVDLARSDLSRAARYVGTLRSAGAPHPILAFCELPVRLAEATLDRLEAGASKLPREDVMRIFEAVVSR